jgi:GNAT superfamily N-acetyltransferase
MLRRKYVFESVSPETIQVSSNLLISSVTTPEDFKVFFRVPWRVYENDVYWVPPLWSEIKDFFKSNNLFWTHAESKLFVAYQEGNAVGRVASVIDYKFVETAGEKVGFFGFFESIRDFNVASALLKVAQEWLESKGMSKMLGPINGRVDVGCGFLYEGFNSPPSILSPYSPRYYIDFVEKYGMKKSRDLLVYYLDLTSPIPEYLKEAAKRCEAKGVKIRGFNRLRAGKEMKWWIKLMKETFSNHWGYVPVSDEEVRTRFGVKQARWFVDSKLFLVAEVDNKPIGFKWSTPDYNQIIKEFNGKIGITGVVKFLLNKHKITQGKFNFVGIDKKYQRQGIASLMNYYTMVEMKRRGYKGAECSWYDEKNIASIRTIEKTGAKLYKKFRVYEKNI